MIIITGATGGIGSHVVRLLSEAGVPARALSRDPSRGQRLPHLTWARADLGDPSTLIPAFEGGTVLFLLSSVVPHMVTLQRNAIEAAREAGVQRVVKLSAFGSSSRSKATLARWHHEVENALKESGLDWTLLRPHYFTQNLLSHAKSVAEEGVMYAASGDGMIPFVDTRDIAASAVATLTQEGHAGKTYVLTGGEAITFGQVAAILSGVLGRRVRYVSEEPEAARARLIASGVAPWLADDYIAIADYHRAGGATATITRTVADLTGRPPRTVVAFAYESADTFRPD